MPRLKQPEVKFVKVQRTIKSYGLTGTRIAPAIHVSPVTARKKLRNPELFTIRELDSISKCFGIPWSEIQESMVH